MATPLQAAASQKATTTTSTTVSAAALTSGQGAKSLNGAHTHTSSSTGVAASHASHASHAKSESTAIHNSSSSASLSTSVHIKEKIYESISIDVSEEQKLILREGPCSFGDVLSQVPWMKFRLVAEPNMDVFASDIRLRTFIRQVTELTVSIVTKQCTEEIAILVATLVASLTSSMEVRIKLIVETIIKQIATLCLEDTMTACQNLDEIKERTCFGKTCEPQYSHGTYGDVPKHTHDVYGDDKHKHPHDSYGDADKHRHPHDGYSDNSDKYKRPGNHHEHEKPKPETPKKLSGKLTPLPGAK